MASYILFYSNKDKASRRFNLLLQKQSDLDSNFRKLCIDDKYSETKTCKWQKILDKYEIKYVPSLIVNDSVLQGRTCFEWLYNFVYSNRRAPVVTQMNLHEVDSNLFNNTITEPMAAPEQSHLSTFEYNDINMNTVHQQPHLPSINCSVKNDENNYSDALAQLQKDRGNF